MRNTKHIWIFSLITALVLFSVSAMAQTELTTPSTVIFRGVEEKIIELTVTNDNTLEQSLQVEYFAPKELEYKFVQVPEFIDAGEELVIKLKIESNTYLIGNQYMSTIVIRVGDEEIRKPIQLVFAEKPVSLDTEIVPPLENVDENNPIDQNNPLDQNTGTGFVGLGTVQLEMALNIILTVIAAVLAVILILRIRTLRNMQNEGVGQK